MLQPSLAGASEPDLIFFPGGNSEVGSDPWRPRRPLAAPLLLRLLLGRTCPSGWVHTGSLEPVQLGASGVAVRGKGSDEAGAPRGTLEGNHTPRKSSGQTPVPPSPPSLPQHRRAPAAGQTLRPVSSGQFLSLQPFISLCSRLSPEEPGLRAHEWASLLFEHTLHG